MSTDKESTPDYRIMRPRNKGTINPCGTWLYAGTVDLFGLGGSLTPRLTPSIFRWYINVNEANTVWMTRLPGGVAPLNKEWLNSGEALAANAGYIFDMVINTNDKVNLRMSNAGTPIYVSVAEVPMMW